MEIGIEDDDNLVVIMGSPFFKVCYDLQRIMEEKEETEREVSFEFEDVKFTLKAEKVE